MFCEQLKAHTHTHKGIVCEQHTHKDVVCFEATETGAGITGEDHSQFISGGIETGGLCTAECAKQALVSSRAIVHPDRVKPAVLKPVGLKPGHKRAEERRRSS